MILLSEAFEIKDLGDLHYFLGLQITRTTKGLFLHQAKYAHDLLVKHNMLTSKPAKTPCTPHLRLVPDEGSLLADPRLYHRLVGSLHYLTLLISTLLCIRFANSCLNPLMFTWLLQSVYSGISMAQWPMVSSFNLVLCHFQPFFTQIGLVILMIDGPLRAIWSIWGTTLLPGVPRSSWLSLGLPQNLNIELLPLLLQNFVGFINYWRIWASFSPILANFGVTMILPWPLLPILCFTPEQSTLKLIIISFEIDFFAGIFRWNTLPLMISS